MMKFATKREFTRVFGSRPTRARGLDRLDRMRIAVRLRCAADSLITLGATAKVADLYGHTEPALCQALMSATAFAGAAAPLAGMLPPLPNQFRIELNDMVPPR